VPMAITPIQNVWFDDAATLAMGEAFDHACKTLQDFGSAVPAIVANFIIAAAKNGERDPGRLYEQALKAYGIDDTSMLLVSVGDPPSQPTLRSRTQRNHRKPGSARAVTVLKTKFSTAYRGFPQAGTMRSARYSYRIKNNVGGKVHESDPTARQPGPAARQ
jgi:hypothetical protein